MIRADHISDGGLTRPVILPTDNGGWPPPSRAKFEAERSPRGALLVGSPQDVTDKILLADRGYL